MRTSRFEERIASGVVETAQRRDESTQSELTTFDHDFGWSTGGLRASWASTGRRWAKISAAGIFKTAISALGPTAGWQSLCRPWQPQIEAAVLRHRHGARARPCRGIKARLRPASILLKTTRSRAGALKVGRRKRAITFEEHQKVTTRERNPKADQGKHSLFMACHTGHIESGSWFARMQSPERGMDLNGHIKVEFKAITCCQHHSSPISNQFSPSAHGKAHF
jgi:hypothetical protein